MFITAGLRALQVSAYTLGLEESDTEAELTPYTDSILHNHPRCFYIPH